MSHSHEPHETHADKPPRAHVRPLHDFVLVERHESEKVTPGGIIVPDNAREKSLEVTVRAVGPGKALESGSIQAMAVKVGDVVFLGKYAGAEITVEGRKLLVVREDDILGVKEL